jgi:hypothetical protein
MRKPNIREQSDKPLSFFDSDRNTVALILLHGIASGRNGATIGTPESTADAAFRYADAILARARTSAPDQKTRNGVSSEESGRASALLS